MKKTEKKNRFIGERVNRIIKGLKPFTFLPCYLFVLLSTYHLLLTTDGFAGSTQDWLKNIGKQKVRKVHSKHTAVAAVRGVDEPGQVDKNARNYEAVHQMEQKIIPQDKLLRFIQEGKLVLFSKERLSR